MSRKDEQDLVSATKGSGQVSIVIPVYNTEAYLRVCVESVLRQTHSALDVVLVDDGSTDSSGRICDDYRAADPRVRVIHQPNAGPSQARNAGMDAATGDYLFFLDSDDWLAYDCIEVLLDLVRSHGTPMAMSGTSKVLDPDQATPRPASPSTITVWSCEEVLRHPATIRPVHTVSACAKLMHRSLVSDIRFPAGRLHEDVSVTHLFLLRAGRVAVTSRELHFYRQRPGSITDGRVSLKSAADKARAHMERGAQLASSGLQDVAALEFARGLSWHLRAAAVVASSSSLDSSCGTLAEELEAQREILGSISKLLTLGADIRLLLRGYQTFPALVIRLWPVLVRLSVRGQLPAHPIEGEGPTH